MSNEIVIGKKNTTTYISMAATLCTIISLIAYFFRAGTPLVTGAMIIAVVAGVAILFVKFPLREFVPFLAAAVALGGFVNAEGFYVSNVLVGIDNSSFEVTFIISALFLLVGCVLGIVTAVRGLDN